MGKDRIFFVFPFIYQIIVNILIF